MFKMNKKIMLIMVLVVWILPVYFVSAQASYKQGDNINFKVACVGTDGKSCDSTTTCKLNLFSPTNAELISNQTMQFLTDGVFNHTIAGNLVNVSGEYCGVVYCDKTVGGYDNFCFEINPLGYKQDESRGFVSVGILIAMITLAFFFLYLSGKFTDGDYHAIGLTFMIVSVIFSFITVFLGYVYSKDILVLSSIVGVQQGIFLGLMWIIAAISLITFVFFIFKIVTNAITTKNRMKWGDAYDEAARGDDLGGGVRKW